MSQPRGKQKNADQTDVKDKEKTALVGTQESVKKEQCQPQAKEQCQQQAKTLIRHGSEKIRVRPRGDSSCPRVQTRITDRESGPKQESENFHGQVKEAECEVGVR